MRKNSFLAAAAVFALRSALPAEARDPAEAQEERAQIAQQLTGLKQEFESLRASYEARFAALEARLQALERESPARAETSQPAEAELLKEAAAALSGVSPPAQAAAPPPPPTPTGGVFQSLNPNISVIGDFLGAANRNLPDFEGASVDLREVEIAFQSQIDPFARADFFVAVPSLEEVELEEGYLTFLTLPSNFLARVGKMRVPFGRANVDHRPETFAVDRPDVITANFGEEGLAEMGVSIARLIPNPWDLFMEIELDLLDGANEVSFGGGRARDLLYNLHYRTFFDLNPEHNLNLGLSYATGVNTAFAEGEGTGRTHLEGLDFTYRWKPLARAKYRSFLWQTELVLGQRETPLGRLSSQGLYSFASYQLSRRWFIGGRFDWSEAPDDPVVRASSGSALVDFFPSEFQRFRLQYKLTDRREGPLAHQLLFQWFYVIGTHGAHKF